MEMLISSRMIYDANIFIQEQFNTHLAYIGQNEPSDELYPLIKCFESNGLIHALWCLPCIKGYDREIRLFAVKIARSVLHIYEKRYPIDMRLKKSIDAAEKFANGKINLDDLKIAASVVSSAIEAADANILSVPHNSSFSYVAFAKVALAAFGVTGESDAKSALDSVMAAVSAAGAYRAATALPGIPLDIALSKGRKEKLEEITQEFIKLCNLEGEYAPLKM